MRIWEERRRALRAVMRGAPATDGKDTRMIDNIKDRSGIYKLGFNKYSFLGILLPLLFVVIVGGGLAALVVLL
jgi:hypothetical protein